MRKVLRLGLGASVVCGAGASLVASFVACSSSPAGFSGGSEAGLFNVGDSGHDGGTGAHDGSLTQADTGHLMNGGDSGGVHDVGPDGITVVTTTTIYAHTDTELYSMDPMTKVVTDLGTFAGLSGSYYDDSVTDLAVNAAGEVYVNSEQVVYKATLPTAPGAGVPVQLTQVVNTDPTLKDGGDLSTRFYALAFAPAGALDTTETLVGGDSNGELWAIPTTGAPIDIGHFGLDPDNAKNDTPTNILALSGDLVFYLDAQSMPTGLATVRSCKPGTGGAAAKCTETNDYLAGVNMANLKSNYAAKSTTGSLLAGIYGGTATADGPGTGHGELFGLGAWDTSVYAFSRCIHCYDGGTSPVPAELLQIDTTSGAASVLPGSGPFSFTDGWSGAGVTTKVTITVNMPPPTQPPK